MFGTVRKQRECAICSWYLRGGSQVLSLAKMISKITIDHVPTLVSETFEGIFGPLTHTHTAVGLDRLLGSKSQLFK